MGVICHTKWLRWPVSVAGMARIGRYLPCEVPVLARIGWPLWPVVAVTCRVKWLSWPVSVAGMTRTSRYSPYEVAVLARIGGRHDPGWPLSAV